MYRGGTFRGVYHRTSKKVYLFDDKRTSSQLGGAEVAPVKVTGLDDPLLRTELEEEGYARLREESELLDAAGDAFDAKKFLAGDVSPMFFGSAMNNFGLEAFLDTFCELMPPPGPHHSTLGEIPPDLPHPVLVVRSRLCVPGRGGRTQAGGHVGGRRTYLYGVLLRPFRDHPAGPRQAGAAVAAA